MKIYYLNSEKKPVGPHSKEEILSLKETGLINDETLVAVAGDSKWRPLSELLADCSTWNTVENSGSELNLWQCFKMAFQKYAVFSGRASRKEFWSFVLFYIIFNYAIQIPMNLMTRSVTAAYEEKINACADEAPPSQIFNLVLELLQEPTVLIANGIGIFYWLVMLVPFLSLSVRRLHDTGTKAWGVIVGSISYVLMFGFSCLLMKFVLQNMNSENFEVEPLLTIVFGLTAAFLCYIAISIYLFIKMLLPGNKGENKYGAESRN